MWLKGKGNAGGVALKCVWGVWGLTVGLVDCGKFGPLRLGLIVEGLQTMLRSLDFILLALTSL